MIYTQEFYAEFCCEECTEIVHNHFHCPVCDDINAGTDIFSAIWELYDNTFYCEECNSKFEFIECSMNEDGDYSFKVVENSYLNKRTK